MSKTIENQIRETVDSLAPDFIATRHFLHQNPELSDQERKTSALVAERLRAFGIDEVRTGVGGHGVVGTLHGTAASSQARKLVALRADMDALPIQETNDVEYKSCVPGVMHACGHDGHTSTLLGTAAVLARLREELPGSVRFIFQPAEETVDGAVRMCAEGVMEGVTAIAALHGWPGMAVGRIGVRSGAMMASSDTWDLTIKGKGAHAAYPHLSIDPIVIGAQIVAALQTVSSREISPVEPVVVTVAQFHAGTAYNIIPGIAEIKGTCRCLSPELRKTMAQRLERIAAGICSAMGAEYEFKYKYGTPVTYNNPDITQLLSEIGAECLGAENVVNLEHPSMGAEDFACYLDYAPGAMFRLGVGVEMTALHTPTYNFADGAVPKGMEMFARFAMRVLQG